MLWTYMHLLQVIGATGEGGEEDMAWTGKEECVNECKTGDCRKKFDGIAGKVMDTLISNTRKEFRLQMSGRFFLQSRTVFLN